jgi:hypothetical protein
LDNPVSVTFDKMLDADNLRASIEESESFQRLALEQKYGPDVRSLAEDDDELLSYLESDNLALKQVALLCLLYFHPVYPERILRMAADYIVNGDDLGIRSLCVRYLSNSRIEEITSILGDCASKLGAREPRPGDGPVLRIIAFDLELFYRAPKPFAYLASIAEEILARLDAASARND